MQVIMRVYRIMSMLVISAEPELLMITSALQKSIPGGRGLMKMNETYSDGNSGRKEREVLRKFPFSRLSYFFPAFPAGDVLKFRGEIPPESRVHSGNEGGYVGGGEG